MIRKPTPGSSGSSRLASPGASGSSASSSAGTKAGGSKAGTRMGGTAMGTKVGFTTDVGIAEPAGGAALMLPQRKPKPVLVGLAIGGWATFAVQWIFVIVLIIGRGGGTHTVNVAKAEPPTPRNTVQSQPTATPPRTNPTPPRTDPSRTDPTPTRPATSTPPVNPTPSRPTAAVTPPPRPPAPPVDSNNPFLALKPNALGMELNRGHTAVLVDAVDRSNAWLTDGKAALMAGLTRPARGQTVSLLATRDGEVTGFDANPFTPGSSRLTELARFFSPLDTKGKGGLGAGLDAAVESGADEVVFLTSRTAKWGGYLKTLQEKLSPEGRRVTLHVVMIGQATPADLSAFVRGPENNGRFTQILPEQLKAWRDAAE